MTAQNFSTNLGIGATPELDQSKDPDGYVDSLKLRNGIKILQGALDTYTGTLGEEPRYWGQQSNPALWNRLQNLTRTYALASEDISAGSMVNFYSSAGVLKVRNATAAVAGSHAHGYSTTTVSSGSYGEFIQQGTCFYVGGLTIGTTYYLSNTTGRISATAGTVVQRVGYAIGASILIFRPDLV